MIVEKKSMSTKVSRSSNIYKKKRDKEVIPTLSWFRASTSGAWVADRWGKSSRGFWLIVRAIRFTMGSNLFIFPCFDSLMSLFLSKFPFEHIGEKVDDKMCKGRESLAQSSLFWDSTLWIKAAGYLSFFSSAFDLCTARCNFLLSTSPSSPYISSIKTFAISAGVHLATDMFPTIVVKKKKNEVN